MINLLPLKAKEELRKEEDWKLCSVLAFLVMIFLIAFSLVLLSVKNYVKGESEAQGILLEQIERELNNPQRQSLQKNLLSFNKTISAISSFYDNQLDSSGLLADISETVPEKINLSNLSIARNDEKQIISCTLSGFSPDRDSLLSFKENLENNERFYEISFPPSNWVKPSDIDFTINFKAR